MKVSIAAMIFYILAIVVGIGGWIANVVKLLGMLGGPVSAKFVVRVVGVIAFPLGAVMGFV